MRSAKRKWRPETAVAGGLRESKLDWITPKRIVGLCPNKGCAKRARRLESFQAGFWVRGPVGLGLFVAGAILARIQIAGRH